MECRLSLFCHLIRTLQWSARAGPSTARGCFRQKSAASHLFQTITALHFHNSTAYLPFLASSYSSVSSEIISTTSAANVTIQQIQGDKTLEETTDLEDGTEASFPDVDKVCQAINENRGADQDMETALQECGVQMSTELVEQVLDGFRFEEKIAFRFFTWAGHQEGYKHKPQTFNEMIDILSNTKYKTKDFAIVCDLLHHMKRSKKSAIPIETLVTVLRNYAEKNLTALRKFAKKKKIRVKTKPEINALNMLLDSLCKCNLVWEAQALYEKLKVKFKPDAKTYTVLFFGWCRLRKPDKAMEILNEMIQMGHSPDNFTYNTALDAFCKAGQVEDAAKLFQFMRTKGSTQSSPSAKTYSIMIVALAQSERMEEAFKVLGEMRNSGCLPDVSTYSEIIEGLCTAGKLDEAYKVLDEMGDKGYPPDIVTYNCFLKVLCNLKKGDEALSLFYRMIEAGCLPSVHTYNTFIKMFCDMGQLDMAFNMWHDMDKKDCARDIDSYCALIRGLFDNGKVQDACLCLEDVTEKGMRLPFKAYDRFLMELSKAGELRMTQRLSDYMRQFYHHRMTKRCNRGRKRMNFRERIR